MLFVHAEDDPIVPTWLGRAAYTKVPWPKDFVTFPGQEHIWPYLSPKDPHFDFVIKTTLDFLRHTSG